MNAKNKLNLNFRIVGTIILFLFFQPLVAQIKIQGEIIDKNTREPVPFANILLYQQGADSISTFTSSDLNGTFNLEVLNSGLYKLSIDFIGMERLNFDSLSVFQDINLKKIYLSQAVTLDEVVITGKKANVKLGLDKKTFNVSDNPINEGGNATDVLSNLPSVDVDQEGNISMRGSGELRILIDGKPTGLSGEDIGIVLAQIPANTIKDIEIITVPTAKYDAESAGGIINIILKENKREGTSGNVNVSYGSWDKVNLSGLLGLKKKTFSIDLSYGLRTGTFTNNRETLAENSNIDSLNLFSTTAAGKKNNQAHLGKVKLNFKTSENTEIGINSLVSHGKTVNTRSTDYFWNNKNMDNQTSLREALNEQSKLGLLNSLYFSWRLKEDAKLSLSSTHAHGATSTIGSFTELGINQQEQNTLFSDDFTQNIDFVLPRKKIKWEIGSQFTHRQIKNNFLYETINSFSPKQENNFKYFDHITAAYLMPSVQVNTWKVSAGYRIEHTYSNSKNSSTDLDIERSYFMHFPSLNLSKKLGKNNELGLNYSRRITRPNAKQLNPGISLADPYSLSAGNPDITPATNDVSEVVWLTKSTNFTLQNTLFYQIRKNRVRRIRFVDDQGISTVKWMNYKGEDYFGYELFTSIELLKDWTTNFSINIYQRNTDGSNISEEYKANYFGWDSKLNTTLSLPGKILIGLKGEYNSPKEIVIGTIDARYHVDLSIQKKLFKNKGKLALRWSDIFNSKQFQIATLVDNWVQSGIYKRETRILFISFNYSFGQTKKANKNKIKNIRQTN